MPAGNAAGAIAAPAEEPEQPAVPVRGPAQVIALAPWLLRYRPGDADLVVIGTVPPRGRVRLTLRLDLPDPAIPVMAAAQARHAVAVLAVQGCSRVTVVGFGPDRLVAPAVALVRQAATAAAWRPANCCAPMAAGTGPTRARTRAAARLRAPPIAPMAIP